MERSRRRRSRPPPLATAPGTSPGVIVRSPPRSTCPETGAVICPDPATRCPAHGLRGRGRPQHRRYRVPGPAPGTAATADDVVSQRRRLCGAATGRRHCAPCLVLGRRIASQSVRGWCCARQRFLRVSKKRGFPAWKHHDRRLWTPRQRERSPARVCKRSWKILQPVSHSWAWIGGSSATAGRGGA